MYESIAIPRVNICAVCSVSSEKVCSNCKKVAYCGVPHQKIHWKTHRPNCFPATQMANEQFGRFLVATRDISAGELIFIDTPLMVSPGPAGNLEKIHPICLGCCVVLTGQFSNNGSGVACKNCSWTLCKQDCNMVCNFNFKEKYLQFLHYIFTIFRNTVTKNLNAKYLLI